MAVDKKDTIYVYRTRSGHVESINGSVWKERLVPDRDPTLDPLILAEVLLRDEPPFYMALAFEEMSSGRVIQRLNNSVNYVEYSDISTDQYLGVTVDLANVEVKGIVIYKNEDSVICEVGEYPVARGIRIVATSDGRIVPFQENDLILYTTQAASNDFLCDNTVFFLPRRFKVFTNGNDAGALGKEIEVFFIDENGQFSSELITLHSVDSSTPIQSISRVTEIVAVRMGAGVFTEDININSELNAVCAVISSPATGFYGLVDGTSVDALGHSVLVECDQVVAEPVVVYGLDGLGSIQTEILTDVPVGGIRTHKSYRAFSLMIGGDRVSNGLYTTTVLQDVGFSVGSPLSVGEIQGDCVVELNSKIKYTGVSIIHKKEYYEENDLAFRDYKESVRVSTIAVLNTTYDNGTAGVGATLTANVNGAVQIDGISLVLEERVLVQHQGNASENGIYKVIQVGSGSQPYILQRSKDADNTAKITAGLTVFVGSGTYGAMYYFLEVVDPVEVGVTDLIFAVLSSGGSSGIGSLFQIEAGRDSSQTTNRYLESASGIPTNLTPIVLPFDATLIAMSMATDVTETWTAEIHLALTLVPGATLSVVAGTSAYVSALNINFSAGDGLQFYLLGTDISRPRVDLIFKRR